MSRLKALALAAALPLAAQTWDVRLEVPFPKGQNLPQTLISGTGQLVRGDTDTGHGFTVSANHRLLRVNPVLKLEWGAEFSDWRANGQIVQDTVLSSSQLRQVGIGLALNAQFWLPFTGCAGEVGLIGRLQRYQFEAEGTQETEYLARPWLRVGLRYRTDLPFSPYLAASYQQPITKNHPLEIHNAGNVQDLLKAQGSGLEFERMWTFGVGVMF